MSKLFRTIGPPGCGKTTWLARQCLNAAQKYGGSSIAIASLTRTAAAEIASRSTGVPRQNIGTLHSHAFRQLKLTKAQVAETTHGVKEWNENVRVASWKLSKRSVANPENAGPDDGRGGDEGDALLSEIALLRARCVDSRLWPQRLQGFWKAWSAWKSATGRLDFTDMIEQALETVESLGASIVMLDEAQDMSLLEMRLARSWGSAAEQLLIVGDPDQTIYEWRGSDPGAFFEGEAHLQQVLSQSYRVPRAVHKLAVSWIDQIEGRQKVEYRPRDEEGKVLQHHQLCWREPDGLRQLVQTLAEDGSTVAVLAPCAYMLTPLAQRMKELYEPYHNPYRPERWEWNPLNVDKLLAFIAPRLYGRPWTWDEVAKWVEPLAAKGVMVRGAKVFFAGKLERGWKFEQEEDRVIRKLGTVLDQFLPEHRERVFNCDVGWWEDHLLVPHRPRQRYVCGVTRKYGTGALQETPRLSLGTIHSYKGGEADKVVLVPDLSTAGAVQWNSRDPSPVVRQFYVGITRARKELHVLGSAGSEFVQLHG